MEERCLNNKDEYPRDDVLLHHLGRTKIAWDTFLKFMKKDYPAITTEWRYYNDGKSWLFKVTEKKKTMCWVSVYDKMFRTTFYFSDKAEELLKGSKLKKEFKDQFMNGKNYGKIRGITVKIKKASDLETTKLLMDIKRKMK